MVSPFCRKGTGQVSNEDLALLRACTVADEIAKLENHRRKVLLLRPISYTPVDRKYGDEFKAAILYLLGENGGCKK
jgi:hypothetical protein